MRISDWSSDVCSSVLRRRRYGRLPLSARIPLAATLIPLAMAAGCIGGFLRLRPVITGSMTATALAVGFLAAVATIVPLSGGDEIHRAELKEGGCQYV